MTAVRVAVWNLGWNRTKSQLQEMWSILQDDIQADVALLQEVVPPEGLRAVWRPITGRCWGSAVVGLTVEVEEVTLAKGRANSRPRLVGQNQPGTMAVARARIGRTTVTLVSMYGLIDDGYADTTVNRGLSDLTPLFDDPAHERRIVLGGDLNITTQWTGPQSRYRTWEAATFARVAAFGLVDCLDLYRAPGPLEGCGCVDRDDCRHIQTQRHRSSRRPWQNDYLFASAALTKSSALTQAYVYDSEVIRDLGDHMPLVADFEL